MTRRDGTDQTATSVGARLALLATAVLALAACNPAGDGATAPTARLPNATLGTTIATAAAPSPPPPGDPCRAGGVTYCALNPAVTQATIGQTMCVRGWTATVRPPESYTENLKRQQIAQEGLPGGLSSYEEDHRMPLELGGAPSDVTNLSPESPPSPNPKDADETSLKTSVCSGHLTLVQAQQDLVTTWLAAYPRYKR